MPALSEILAHLAGGLRDNGAQFAPRVLDIMSAATTFLLVTNNTPDSDIGAASYLAAQLRSDDAKKAAAALGISPDLIPRTFADTGLRGSPTRPGSGKRHAAAGSRGGDGPVLLARHCGKGGRRRSRGGAETNSQHGDFAGQSESHARWDPLYRDDKGAAPREPDAGFQ